MWTPSADLTWKPRGRVHVWRYLTRPTRSYNGWHITFDREGAGSLLELLDKLRAADGPRMRTVPLTQPPKAALAVVNARRSYKPRGLSALKLFYDPAAESGHRRMEERENTLELEMGKSSFDEFFLAVAAAREGDGDFSIGKPPLWFWWYPRG